MYSHHSPWYIQECSAKCITHILQVSFLTFESRHDFDVKSGNGEGVRGMAVCRFGDFKFVLVKNGECTKGRYTASMCREGGGSGREGG